MYFSLNEYFVFFWQHAYALELLFDQLHEGAKALDVGSGSGILTACFARMVRVLFLILAPTEEYNMIWLYFFFTSGFHVCLFVYSIRIVVGMSIT